MASAPRAAPPALVAEGLQEAEWREGLDTVGRRTIKRKLENGGSAKDVMEKVRRMLGQHASAHKPLEGADGGAAQCGATSAPPSAASSAAPAPATTNRAAGPATTATPDRRLAEEVCKLAAATAEVSRLARRVHTGGEKPSARPSAGPSAKPSAMPLASTPARALRPHPPSQHRVWTAPLAPAPPPHEGKVMWRDLPTYLDAQSRVAGALRAASDRAGGTQRRKPSRPHRHPRPPAPARSPPRSER